MDTLEESNVFVLDRQNVPRNTDICARNRRRTLLWKLCTGTLKDIFRFDTAIIRHAEKVGILRCLLRLVQNVGATSKYRGLDFYCLENLLDGFYLMKDSDECGRELDSGVGNDIMRVVCGSSSGIV